MPAAPLSNDAEPARPDLAAIASWHAHVYFDAGSRDRAWALRETIGRELRGLVAIGRFHERPVGPHPAWSFQLAFAPADFASVMPWLVLNRAGLDVFAHPNTGDELADHRDRAVWIGRSSALDLAALA